MKNASTQQPRQTAYLRPVQSDDLSWMAATAADPIAVGEHNWGGKPRDAAEVESELRADFERNGLIGPDGGSLIVQLADGTRIGTVDWRAERWGPSQASRCLAFGIALLPEFRSRGYGTEAQRQLVDYLFERTDTHRVQSDTALDNPAEQRSLHKVGMVEEGTVRQAEFRDGTYHDHLLFSILRPEWEGRRRIASDAPGPAPPGPG
jgi:RimJ/RimL family protein N-acetyltransferase